MKRVEFYRHTLGEEEVESVANTISSLFLTTGPRVADFERMFAEYLGVSDAVGVSSCSMGLILALQAHGIGQGDSVITTPMSFVATSNAVLRVGAELRFADVDPKTGFLDLEQVERLIDATTKAIIIVHLHGHLPDMVAWRSFANHHGLVIIEDAAHAAESERDGWKAGAHGDAAVFSFYATKTLTSGDGGCVTANTSEIAGTLRRLRNHGMSKDASARHGGEYQHWDMVDFGWKAGLTDIEASLLIPQLKRLKSQRERRERIALEYKRLLGQEDALQLVDWTGVSSHHLFPVLVPYGRRDHILSALGSKGIGCAVNYRSIHTLKYYRERFGFQPNDFPHAFDWGERTISLPIWPDLPLDDVEYVSHTLSQIVREL